MVKIRERILSSVTHPVAFTGIGNGVEVPPPLVPSLAPSLAIVSIETLSFIPQHAECSILLPVPQGDIKQKRTLVPMLASSIPFPSTFRLLSVARAECPRSDNTHGCKSGRGLILEEEFGMVRGTGLRGPERKGMRDEKRMEELGLDGGAGWGVDGQAVREGRPARAGEKTP
jgi:hypothetical protein